MEKVFLDGTSLTIEEIHKVVFENVSVALSPKGREQVLNSRKYVEEIIEEGKIVYGITTGFGKFSDVFISKENTAQLQLNLIISHACGVGEPFPQDVVKTMMLLRANSLAKGYSGITMETLELLLAMINNNIIPLVPSQGSLGASGDLVPLAHIALVMIGRGKAYLNGEIVPGIKALKAVGLHPVELKAKEGLALINGTQAMTACGVLALKKSEEIKKLADIIAALTCEALNGIIDAYHPKVSRIRPHKGQQDSAENLRNLLAHSRLVSRQGELRVQDPYTLRCIPQVHGGSREALDYVKKVVLTEVNSVTDNPLIFSDEGQVISGGNFHGQPLAIAMDTLAIAISEFANISERRIERLVNPQLSGLPAFLVEDGGVNSGFMIPQYVAASLVSENKGLSTPASVDSIPSSANQEDHVSMGTIAARKALRVVENTINVLAIELLCAVQALDFKEPEKMSPITREIYDLVRSKVSKLVEDRELHEDINKCAELIKTGAVLKVVSNHINLK
ncbi:histidine ammonia-lyase [Anaerobranca gottschalkii]|uniref:Histidine ammonia-lyase n=1 Tax=Anaerobranca gottschalkii DSM 13577 TaxID=1120990 RepID=A0A1I0AWL4_9FIRM|nr:histidine ammonia-lyase [Anaerobranca gottschalkii]SES98784.1 histidine ammonia-lyase [Anaerobranca gottschalkii DSM 13577]